MTTVRTLCAFEDSYFSNLYAVGGEEDEASSCLVLDFSPLAFAEILDALRVGVRDVQKALAIIQSGLEGPQGGAIRDMLDFLGLEWMCGVRVGGAMHAQSLTTEPKTREDGVTVTHPLGLLHELFIRQERLEEGTADFMLGASLSNAESEAVKLSRPDDEGDFYFAAEDVHSFERSFGKLSIWGWWGRNLVRVSRSSRLVFDLGEGNALCPTEVILVIGVPLDRPNIVGLHISAMSDFEDNEPQTLVAGPLSAFGHQRHLLRIEIPAPRRRYYRMFVVRLDFSLGFVDLAPSSWTISFFELFGTYIEALPASLFASRARAPFAFDSLSGRCQTKLLLGGMSEASAFIDMEEEIAIVEV